MRICERIRNASEKHPIATVKIVLYLYETLFHHCEAESHKRIARILPTLKFVTCPVSPSSREPEQAKLRVGFTLFLRQVARYFSKVGLTVRCQIGRISRRFGWVAERFNAPVLKTGVVVRLPWVRIPPHPLFHLSLNVPRTNRHMLRAERLVSRIGVFL